MEATAANKAYCQKSPGLATGSYGLLRAGTITATKGSGQTLTITPGTTWSRTTPCTAPAAAPS
jgi:hypothetical protein